VIARQATSVAHSELPGERGLPDADDGGGA
jgi:hypothetical protein